MLKFLYLTIGLFLIFQAEVLSSSTQQSLSDIQNLVDQTHRVHITTLQDLDSSHTITTIRPQVIKQSDTTEADEAYRASIAYGTSHEAIKKDQSIDPEKVNNRLLYLLISAYEKGSEQSLNLLTEYIFQIGKIKAHKLVNNVGIPIKYENLTDDQKHALSEFLKSNLRVLFPDLENEEMRLKKFQAEKLKFDNQINILLEEKKKIIPYGITGTESDEVLNRVKEINCQISNLLQQQNLLFVNYSNKVSNGATVLKDTELFKSKATDKLLLKFIAKVSIGKGEATRNPDIINHLMALGKTASGFAGPVVAFPVGLGLSGGEVAYNAYQRRNELKFVNKFLENDTTENQLLTLLHVFAPITTDKLTERYTNPISKYNGSYEDIAHLADYAINFMIKNTWNNLRDFPQLKENSTPEEQYSQIAEFLCDKISYLPSKFSRFKYGVNCLLSNAKSEAKDTLIKSGVDTNYFQDTKRFYAKDHIKDESTHHKLKYSIKSERQQEAYEAAIYYGFRKEDKSDQQLHALGYRLFDGGNLTYARNSANSLNRDTTVTVKETDKSKTIRRFLASTGEILAENSPEIYRLILKSSAH
jgi:hypothetical protein